jgi:hypothetical protein
MIVVDRRHRPITNRDGRGAICDACPVLAGIFELYRVCCAQQLGSLSLPAQRFRDNPKPGSLAHMRDMDGSAVFSGAASALRTFTCITLHTVVVQEQVQGALSLGRSVGFFTVHMEMKMFIEVCTQHENVTSGIGIADLHVCGSSGYPFCMRLD